MAFELIISKKAEEEAKNAIYYYDQINHELGDRFFTELLGAYHKLSNSPQYYSILIAEYTPTGLSMSLVLSFLEAFASECAKLFGTFTKNHYICRVIRQGGDIRSCEVSPFCR